MTKVGHSACWHICLLLNLLRTAAAAAKCSKNELVKARANGKFGKLLAQFYQSNKRGAKLIRRRAESRKENIRPTIYN